MIYFVISTTGIMTQPTSFHSRALLWLTVFTLPALTSFPCMGAYIGSGTVDYKYFNRDETLQRSNIVNFTIEVDTNNNNWKCKLIPQDEKTQKELHDYVEVSHDGDSLYYLTSFETRVSLWRQNGKTVGTNVAEAVIVKGRVPHSQYSSHHVGAVWFALASSRYLNDSQRKAVEPPVGLNGWGGIDIPPESKKTQQAVWKRSDKPPGLPTEAIFYHRVDSRQRTNTIYAVSDWSVTSNHAFPSNATLKVRQPKDDTAPNGRWFTRHVYQIHLDEVSLASDVRIAFPPVVPGMTLISDRRFQGRIDQNDVSYFARERLPTVKEAQSTRAYQKALAKSSGRTRYSTLISVGISLGLIGGVFILAYSRRNSKMKKRKTQT